MSNVIIDAVDDLTLIDFGRATPIGQFFPVDASLIPASIPPDAFILQPATVREDVQQVAGVLAHLVGDIDWYYDKRRSQASFLPAYSDAPDALAVILRSGMAGAYDLLTLQDALTRLVRVKNTMTGA